jgi:hypothetical protein
MTILTNQPPREITPEEVREFIRRAHADRAASIRQTLAGLLWRRKGRRTINRDLSHYKVRLRA